ncbi:hypothetical protein C0J52_15569, partial [Blattella germanica]
VNGVARGAGNGRRLWVGVRTHCPGNITCLVAAGFSELADSTLLKSRLLPSSGSSECGINYPYIEFIMSSTIGFHVVIENNIRPVKIILYYFNRGPPGRNGILRSSPDYAYKAQLE